MMRGNSESASKTLKLNIKFTKPRASLAYTRNQVQDNARRVSREHNDKDVVTSKYKRISEIPWRVIFI